MIQRRVLTGLVGPGLVTAAARWCDELGVELDLADADRYRLALCVEELTTNLASHGGAECAGRPVRCVAEVDTRRLHLELVDPCPPFDPLAHVASPVPATLAELDVGGRGIQLLRAFTDDQRYERREGHNRLTLTFDLERSPAPPPRPDGLADVSLFQGVPEAVVDEVLGPLTLQDVGDDMAVLERGEVNDAVLLVLRGRLRVYLDRPEGEDFFEVGPGECVGEMSVVDDLPVSAHVRAMEGARLLVVDASTFLGRLLGIPAVARNLLSAQAERMRRSDRLTIARMRALLEAEQARREMDYARGIQASLLPAEPLLPDEPRLDCVGRMRPAREVGGDFYDLFLLDERHVLLVVADVCGKGLPAALFMVRAIAALRAQPRHVAPAEDHLDELVARLNAELCERNTARQYLTAFFGLLDLDTLRLRYVNAGHNPPLLAVGAEPLDYLRQPVNPPVGMVPGLRYRPGEVRLEPGARLLLYTDGVTEAEDTVGGMLGEERFAEHLRAMPAATSVDLVDAVFARVEAFAEGAEQSDDITVLAVRCTGGPVPA